VLVLSSFWKEENSFQITSEEEAFYEGVHTDKSHASGKPVLCLFYDSNYDQVLPDMWADFVCHWRQIIYEARANMNYNLFVVQKCSAVH